MKINKIRVYLLILCGLALSLGAASGAGAQTRAVRGLDARSDARPLKADEVRVERTADELRSDVSDAVRHDIDTTDTALIFNAPGPNRAIVYCRSFDQDGRTLGRTATKIPARGLRYIRASDLANGHDFIGSAFCQAHGDVVASAVFIAPGAITNLTVEQAAVAGRARIQFPIVASY